MCIIPKKYWESRKFGEPSTDVPLGTGAYVVKDYKMGQYVVWQRSPTYWALNLPVNKGQLNFDLLRYDYYSDETVAFEAFKAGEFDLYQESIAKNWATLYTGKNFDNGAIIKETSLTRSRRECRQSCSTPSGRSSRTGGCARP